MCLRVYVHHRIIWDGVDPRGIPARKKCWIFLRSRGRKESLGAYLPKKVALLEFVVLNISRTRLDR